jgi:hypothetical protein
MLLPETKPLGLTLTDTVPTSDIEKTLPIEMKEWIPPTQQKALRTTLIAKTHDALPKGSGFDRLDCIDIHR